MTLVQKQWGKEPRLRTWILLEQYKEKIIKAVEKGDSDFPVYLLEFLATVTGVPYRYYHYADWHRLLNLFFLCLSHSPQVELPIISPSHEAHKDSDWDYEGRMWYSYSHMIAKSYGWTMEYISQLKVRDALAIIQEILVDEQLEHEFYYGLSEVAYPYDQATKKSRFVPLTRPHWMRPKVEPDKIEKIMIPIELMPVGVVDYSNALPPELLPKEYETKAG